MTSKHTTGPWLVHSNSTLHMNDREIAKVGHNLKVVSHTAPEGMKPREPMANARLIAAAPRLLDVVRSLLCEGQIEHMQKPCVMAKDHDFCLTHDMGPCVMRDAREALALVDGDV